MSNARLWNDYMAEYDFLTCVDGYTENLKAAAAAAGPVQGRRILDAGSGTGNLSIMLKGAGANVTSCDFSDNAISVHKSKDPQADCVRTSLEQTLPFPEKEFDAVLCLSVLFTLTAAGCDTAVSEFYRVLRPGGKVVITVPAVEAKLSALIRMYYASIVSTKGKLHGGILAFRRLPALLRILQYNWQLRQLPNWEGFHLFDEAELHRLLGAHRFQNIRIESTYGECFLKVIAQKITPS